MNHTADAFAYFAAGMKAQRSPWVSTTPKTGVKQLGDEVTVTFVDEAPLIVGMDFGGTPSIVCSKGRGK